MFKKLFISSIAASLLLSVPVIANHHREKEKIKEIAAEVKQNEKSTAAKVVGGTLQFINKTAPLWAIVIAALVFRNGPFKLAQNTNEPQEIILAKGIEGLGAGTVSWALLKYGTAAAMSQEDIKPLKK
jgi:hypothetical protein